MVMATLHVCMEPVSLYDYLEFIEFIKTAFEYFSLYLRTDGGP